jgi:hypothetical protein
MAYIIKNADGTVLTNLVDGTTDTKSTSLTLIGKNTDNYGVSLNNNLVKLLQNFASVSQPENPVVGQLWYNKADGRLKVFNSSGYFGEISAAILSNTRPTTLKQGDIWIDTSNDQMYFTKNGQTLTLAGPVYSALNGKSGWVVEEFIDDQADPRRVVSLYSDGRLLGMLSTASFIIMPSETIAQGNQGLFDVKIGLTLNNSIGDIQFAGTATNANSVEGITPSLYLVKTSNSDQVLTGIGRLIYERDSEILIGTYADFSIQTLGGNTSRHSVFRNNITDSNITFVTKRSDPPAGAGSAYTNAITLYKDKLGVNVGDSLPGYNLHVVGNSLVDGDLTITKNLTVSGTFTTVLSVVTQIQDKNIELAVNNTLDSFANDGGITLKGTTDKTILYHNSSTSWKSNIDWNLDAGKSYKVSNLVVLTSSTLGTTVTQTSITRVGVMEELTVTNVLIKGNGVTSKPGAYKIGQITAASTSTGSIITVILDANTVPISPIMSTGTTVVISGINSSEFNRTYTISTATTGSFTLVSPVALTTATPGVGAFPFATFNDTAISASAAGHIDASNKRIKNVAYSSVPTDVATVQYANDAVQTFSEKGLAITIDITNMTTPNTAIIGILTALVPPINDNFDQYQAESLYDLPNNYRARVLCKSTTVQVKNLPINVASSSTQVLKFPDGVASAITYLAITAGTLTTATNTVYSVKEFRVEENLLSTPTKRWIFVRDVSIS